MFTQTNIQFANDTDLSLISQNLGSYFSVHLSDVHDHLSFSIIEHLGVFNNQYNTFPTMLDAIADLWSLLVIRKAVIDHLLHNYKLENFFSILYRGLLSSTYKTLSLNSKIVHDTIKKIEQDPQSLIPYVKFAAGKASIPSHLPIIGQTYYLFSNNTVTPVKIKNYSLEESQLFLIGDPRQLQLLSNNLPVSRTCNYRIDFLFDNDEIFKTKDIIHFDGKKWGFVSTSNKEITQLLFISENDANNFLSASLDSSILEITKNIEMNQLLVNLLESKKPQLDS